MSTLIIIRGLPGSGKTTFAKKLANTLNASHFEADMYFTDDKGNYNFDSAKIKDAHEWCFKSVQDALESNKVVIVSNTFTQKWEYAKYLTYCAAFNHEYHIVTMLNFFDNIHNVPQKTYDSMKKRFEFGKNDILVDIVNENRIVQHFCTWFKNKYSLDTPKQYDIM
jgi:tRNA uridine 5-carbamoylmethylation protein Kti12